MIRGWLSVFLLFAIASTAFGRPWTSKAGSSVEGEFVRLSGQSVVISVNGEEKQVGLSQLSEQDQAYAHQRGGEAVREALLMAAGGIEKARDWTDRNGQTIKAKFGGLSTSGADVNLMVGTRRQTVPYTTLSDDDQQIVRAAMDSQLGGTWLPPHLGKFPDRRSFRIPGTSVYGRVVGLDKDGQIGLLSSTGSLGAVPLSDLNTSDELHVREQFSIRGMGNLLPADPNMREWFDWKGNAFQGRLNPDGRWSSFSSTKTCYFIGGGKEFTKSYFELSESDRDEVLNFKPSNSTNLSGWTKFSEPPTEIRNWKTGAVSTVEGKFVRLSGSYVYLRTAGAHEARYLVRLLSDEDRVYLESQGVEIPEPTTDPDPDPGTTTTNPPTDPGTGDASDANAYIDLEMVFPNAGTYTVTCRVHKATETHIEVYLKTPSLRRELAWQLLTSESRDKVRTQLRARGEGVASLDFLATDIGPKLAIETIERRIWSFWDGSYMKTQTARLLAIDMTKGEIVLGDPGRVVFPIIDIRAVDQLHLATITRDLDWEALLAEEVEEEPEQAQPPEKLSEDELDKLREKKAAKWQMYGWFTFWGGITCAGLFVIGIGGMAIALIVKVVSN